MDADRYLVWLRKDEQQALETRYTKARMLWQFFGFLILRYQRDASWHSQPTSE